VPGRTTLRYVVVPDLEGDESGLLDLIMERASAAGPVPQPGRGGHSPAAGCWAASKRGSCGCEPRSGQGGGTHVGRPPSWCWFLLAPPVRVAALVPRAAGLVASV
jgi:hypothetical protein